MLLSTCTLRERLWRSQSFWESIFVGFGIKSCQDIKQIISDGADGVIIGSELIRQLDAGGIEAVQAYIRSLGLSSISKQLA